MNTHFLLQPVMCERDWVRVWCNTWVQWRRKRTRMDISI